MARRAAVKSPLESILEQQRLTWHDVRCRQCGLLLYRVLITAGTKVECRCRKCGRMSIYPSTPEPGNGKIIKIEAIETVAPGTSTR